MKCNKCGYENNDKNKYGENCGNKLKKNIFLISLIKILIPTLIALIGYVTGALSIFLIIYINVYSIIDYFILYKNFKYSIISNSIVIVSFIIFIILSTIGRNIILCDGIKFCKESDLLLLIILVPSVLVYIFIINNMVDLILYIIKKVKNKS